MADLVVRCERCHVVAVIDFQELATLLSSQRQSGSRTERLAYLSQHIYEFTQIFLPSEPRIGDCGLLVTHVPLASTCLYCGNNNLHPSTLERLQELAAEFLAEDHTLCPPGHQHTVLFSQK